MNEKGANTEGEKEFHEANGGTGLTEKPRDKETEREPRTKNQEKGMFI